ncbi:MAG: ABC transporter substrate-binding protein [Clostridiales bacterium]|nr:ABC transporter substrate-binding protein [Clostridiales bacterium]
MKKILSLLLACAVLSALFTSCSTSQEDAETETTQAQTTTQKAIETDDETFKISYTQSDSLNPYTSTSQNNIVLEQLVFEGLFTLDDNYKASLNIASDYEYTGSKTLKITIDAEIKFSDGTSITASDVVRSFYNAQSSDYWSNIISGISSCSAADESTVTFSLKFANSYAHNLLVFPIAAAQKDSNGFYVGSGRYYFDKENGETVLKANTQNGFSPYITTIHLENITSSSSIDNAVNIGNISFAFRDLSSDSSKKITAGKKLVNMNNLVYIGINSSGEVTGNVYIRRAISYAVDRAALVKSAYGSFAAEATSVFNPQFELAETEIFSTESDSASARQAIANSGISSAKLELLVNKDNDDRLTAAKLIKQQLEAVGFTVTLKSVSYSKYLQLIENGDFDIYLGEIKLPYDMALTAFFDEDGAASAGIDLENSKTAAAYESYLSGDAELGAFLLEFIDEMPYVPLLYRKGMICFSKAMSGDVQSTYTDCFANIEAWNFS